MWKKTSSSIMRLLGVAGLASSLASSGCDEPENVVGPAAEQRQGGFANIAAQMASDEDFLAVIDVTVELAGELYAAQRTQPGETVEAIAVTINHPSFPETTDPPTLVADLGGNPAHLAQIAALAGVLTERYGLQEATPEQLRVVFATALSKEPARSHLEGAIENEIHDIDGDVDTTVDACEALCIAEYSVAASAAVAAYIGELIAAVAAGPAGPVVAIIGLAQFNWTMAETQARLNRCMDECNGIFSDECGWDPDCGNDEYCWKGVLGIGENQCKPLKDEGKVCSRDGQCDTGCCKYHFWSNPVSQVCRPSDRCN